MKPKDIYVHWGGQRYVLVLLVTVLCSFLLWQDKIKSPDYALVICTIVGAYIAGRTYQKTKNGDPE